MRRLRALDLEFGYMGRKCMDALRCSLALHLGIHQCNKASAQYSPYVLGYPLVCLFRNFHGVPIHVGHPKKVQPTVHSPLYIVHRASSIIHTTPSTATPCALLTHLITHLLTHLLIPP